MAEGHPQYDGFEAGIIVLDSAAGEIDHRQGSLVYDGETLVGGWAKVYRKDRSRPYYSEVKLAEYDTGKSLWNGKKSTMIRKVAVNQALREAFPSLFGSLYDESEANIDAAKFQKRFFFNDATPNIIIGMPKSTEDQRKRFRAEWLERFKGVFQSHGVATVNGEVTINKVGESMKDMDMVQGRIFLRDAALEHFGVPREIMGITESSNRATSEAAQFIYAQNVLMPNLKRREQAINRQLVPLFGPDLVWHFDDIIPRNQEFDKAVANDGWNSGYLTRNEAREKVGV